jgi:hypothetical protein
MSSSKIKIIFLYLLLIFFFGRLVYGHSVVIDGTTYYFRYRRQITIDYNRVAGSSNHLSYPFMFDSTVDSGLQDDLKYKDYPPGKIQNIDGWDIVFADENGGDTQYDHEIEYYDETTGEFIAWVRIPTLYYDQNTILYIFYGNYGVPTISSTTEHVTDVWDVNYLAVHHFEESPTGTITDSTGYGKNMTGNNMDASDLVDGQVGQGFNFDSSDSEYLISTSNITIQAFTFSLWCNPQTHSDWEVLMNFDTDGWAGNFRYFAIDNGDGLGYDGEGGIENFGFDNVTEGQWQYFALTYDNFGVMRAYRNGTRLGSPQSKTIASRTDDFEVASYDLGNELHDGIIDEVRISNMARDQYWLITEWRNHSQPNIFYSVGGPTLVDLSYFRATSLDSAVILEWATETELDNAGFNIWRSEEKDGQCVRINPYFIPADGEAGFGAEYSFTDYYVQNGKIYYYKLEDIDIYGKSTFHGPVPATPNDIIIIWPDEGKKLHSSDLLFSWASSGSSSYKVEISPNPSFSAAGTLSFPAKGWISGNSLWLAPREWEMVLNTARESGGQLFWRVKAKSKDGAVMFSNQVKIIKVITREK